MLFDWQMGRDARTGVQFPKKPRLQVETRSIPSIELTEAEEKLFSVLVHVAERASKNTILRVAGGWVRDKLLGRQSDDIDVALDNESGVAFAEQLNHYLAEHSLETHTVGVIHANPDQSKHLETAKVMVMSQWVDFTNLRTETYPRDSRIPVTSFGTAEEDAYRRDFTINALFYNLNTREVEDLTGRGLTDLLGEGLIRTPLPARTTFLDDPLRLLRAVRFAARFTFPLAEDIMEAAADEDLKQALISKVSRERVGIELEGMLSGKDARPAMALELMVHLGLAPSVFLLPPDLPAAAQLDTAAPPSPLVGLGRWEQQGLVAVQCANMVLMAREASLGPSAELDVESEAFQRSRPGHRMLFLSAMLVGWSGYRVLDRKKKSAPAAQVLVREGLKLKNKDCEEVGTVLSLLARFKDLASRECSRGELGMAIREAKDMWRTVFNLSCACELALSTTSGEKGRVLSRYEALETRALSLGLDGVWTLKSLLDGNRVVKALNIGKGPMVGRLMVEQIKWQMEFPDGSIDDLVAHLKHVVDSDAGGGEV